jgi:hypothetical protein
MTGPSRVSAKVSRQLTMRLDYYLDLAIIAVAVIAGFGLVAMLVRAACKMLFGL